MSSFITLHATDATEFTTLGLGIIHATSCTITEKAGNFCELSATVPADDERASDIVIGKIICAEMPLRESPEIDIPGESGTVTREIWKNQTSVALNLYSKPAAGVRVAKLASGAECQKISETTQSGTTFFRVGTMDGGAVGYIASGNLQNTGRTVTVKTGGNEPSGSITVTLARRQPFRIYKVERDAESRTLRVCAQHLTYDLGYAIFKHNIPQTSTTINNFWSTYATSSYMTPVVTNSGYSVVDYTLLPFKTNAKLKTVLEVLCEDGGALEQVDGCLMRDGTTLYILPRKDRNSGYDIRLGKNLQSATLTEDATDVITAIRPYGKKFDGTALYGDLVTASNYTTFGPFAKVRYIEYNVIATASTTEAENVAKAKLVQLATADLNGGSSALNTTEKDISTKFTDLYSTTLYSALATTYKLHLYDLVNVIDADVGINIQMMLTEYTYDSIKGEYTRVKLEHIKKTR